MEGTYGNIGTLQLGQRARIQVENKEVTIEALAMCDRVVLYAHMGMGYYSFVKAYPTGLAISDQRLEVSNREFQGHRCFFSVVQSGLQLWLRACAFSPILEQVLHL